MRGYRLKVPPDGKHLLLDELHLPVQLVYSVLLLPALRRRLVCLRRQLVHFLEHCERVFEYPIGNDELGSLLPPGTRVLHVHRVTAAVVPVGIDVDDGVAEAAEAALSRHLSQ